MYACIYLIHNVLSPFNNTVLLARTLELFSPWL